jgi:hypothetical protein
MHFYNKLAIRLVLYRVRAHFAHTHFLCFLFLAPADLLFILQASVAHPRSYEPEDQVEHSYPTSTIPFSFSHTATPELCGC